MMNDRSEFLDGALLQRKLARQSLRGAAARVELVENIRSTNAKLISEAERADNHFLIAHQQTAGVGRRGGVWQSPPSGNLYLSYCFHTQQPLAEVALMPLAFGVEIAQGIESKFASLLSLKWPNDLYLRGKKCGGVLLDTKALANDVMAVVVGVGINVASHPDEKLLGRPTTCLQSECQEPIALFEVALAVMSAITLICELPPAEVSQRLMRQWSKRDFLLGQPVVVSQGSGAAGTTVRGVAQGIAPDGGLRIDLGDTTETFYAGDVSLGHVSGHASVPGSE